MPKNSLNRNERVRSRKLIASLFDGGHKLRHGPLLLIWRKVDATMATSPLMFGVSVSKRKFKRAVDRNAIKRQIREAYRIQKNDILNSMAGVDTSYALFVVYLNHERSDFQKLSADMIKLLEKWTNQLERQKKSNELP